jgi:hypothetical protein
MSLPVSFLIAAKRKLNSFIVGSILNECSERVKPQIESRANWIGSARSPFQVKKKSGGKSTSIFEIDSLPPEEPRIQRPGSRTYECQACANR